MRVALIFATETAGHDAGHASGLPRAFLRVGGATLARHQLGLALALGCERVICIAPALDAHLVALQHMAEAARARFHVLTGARGLVSLVSAADEVIALADGLLAWPDLALPLLEAGPGVLVQPIETGLGAGFERIDINHASAGAMRVPGYLVERLAEMPADCDVFSCLLRAALQARLTQRMLPGEVYESGRWSLVRSEAEAHVVEMAWIRLHSLRSGVASPTGMIARHAVRRFGPALLHAGSNGAVLAVVALVLAMLGLVSSWFGLPAIGFVACAISWVLISTATMLGRIERDSLHLPPLAINWNRVFGWLMDGVLAILMATTISAVPGHIIAERLFAPVMLLGLARLVPQVVPSDVSATRTGGWAGWLRDRAVLAGMLAVAAFFGVAGPAAAVLALAYLGIGLAMANRAARPKQAANGVKTPLAGD